VFGKKDFEVDEVWLVYGDREFSDSEWCNESKKCVKCKGVPKELYSCNNCNRTMDKSHDLVSVSSPFDLSGYLNHSSDPAKINFEKVNTYICILYIRVTYVKIKPIKFD
jgi:hypothetical protein